MLETVQGELIYIWYYFDMISSASATVVDKVAKGRIRALADMIKEHTEGDLFSIQTSTKYPASNMKLVDFAQKEQEQDARPELTTQIKQEEKISDRNLFSRFWR